MRPCRNSSHISNTSTSFIILYSSLSLRLCICNNPMALVMRFSRSRQCCYVLGICADRQSDGRLANSLPIYTCTGCHPKSVICAWGSVWQYSTTFNHTAEKIEVKETEIRFYQLLKFWVDIRRPFLIDVKQFRTFKSANTITLFGGTPCANITF